MADEARKDEAHPDREKGGPKVPVGRSLPIRGSNRDDLGRSVPRAGLGAGPKPARPGVGKSKHTLRLMVSLDLLRGPSEGSPAIDGTIHSLPKEMIETGLLVPLPVERDPESPKGYRIRRGGGLRLAALRRLRATAPVPFEARFGEGIEVELEVDAAPERKIRAINQLLALGLNQGQVACELGVTQAHVSQMLKLFANKEVWADLVDGRITVEEALKIVRQGGKLR